MAKARTGAAVVASCALLYGALAQAAPQPSAADMLKFRPKQDVVFSTPTGGDIDACKIELIKMQRGSGWLMRDGKGQVLRRFFDTTGSGKTDAWCYYLNGVEVYREIYSDKGDQYRWLNSAGMKWGIDANRDGKIDNWRMISAEEVSQEVLQAVVKKDFARLQALMMTEAELKALELPAAEFARVRDVQKGSPAKFQQTLAKLGSLGDKVRWIHLETPAPQCAPAEANGLKQDLVKYAQATVTYLNDGTGKTEELQLGEVFQIGSAWRLIDAPTPADPNAPEKVDDPERLTGTVSKELQPLMDKLEKLDKVQPSQASAPADMAKYNLSRADILEQIAASFKLDKAEDKEQREQWLKQVADCLAAAAQNSDKDNKVAITRLTAWKEKLLKEQPSGGAASHFVFTEMSVDYSTKLSEPKADVSKLQKDWLERLAKFVQDYPKADDAPDGLMQLGMISELVGEEEKAKKWYELLLKDFPSHTHAAMARGAVSRLTLDGKEIALTGSVLGGGASFDIKTLKGKVVAVYYWASWNQQCAQDFTKLKALQTSLGAKGLEIVCVNLDNTGAEATAFLQKSPAPGTHVHEDGGLNSKLAETYGIRVLPTLFLVGKDGKVISRTVQINALEDEVNKAMK